MKVRVNTEEFQRAVTIAGIACAVVEPRDEWMWRKGLMFRCLSPTELEIAGYDGRFMSRLTIPMESEDVSGGEVFSMECARMTAALPYAKEDSILMEVQEEGGGKYVSVTFGNRQPIPYQFWETNEHFSYEGTMSTAEPMDIFKLKTLEMGLAFTKEFVSKKDPNFAFVESMNGFFIGMNGKIVGAYQTPGIVDKKKFLLQESDCTKLVSVLSKLKSADEDEIDGTDVEVLEAPDMYHFMCGGCTFGIKKSASFPPPTTINPTADLKEPVVLRVKRDDLHSNLMILKSAMDTTKSVGGGSSSYIALTLGDESGAINLGLQAMTPDRRKPFGLIVPVVREDEAGPVKHSCAMEEMLQGLVGMPDEFDILMSPGQFIRFRSVEDIAGGQEVRLTLFTALKD